MCISKLKSSGKPSCIWCMRIDLYCQATGFVCRLCLYQRTSWQNPVLVYIHAGFINTRLSWWMYGQTDRQTCKQMLFFINNALYHCTSWQNPVLVNIGLINRWMDRQTDRQTDRKTCKLLLFFINNALIDFIKKTISICYAVHFLMNLLFILGCFKFLVLIE